MTGLTPALSAPASPGARTVTDAVRRAAPALLAFACVRLLSLTVLAVWSRAAGSSPRQLLSGRWDAIWYTRVAEHGYGFTLDLGGGRVHSDLAFFPLLPWLERGVAACSPLTAADAGLAVSAVASLFAAWALFLVGERVYGRRAGVVLAALWAALPVSVVQSMAYSESLFTALAAWGVYAVLTGRWVWAGWFALLAGATRPVGAAVVAAVWVAAALALASGGRWRTAWRTDRRMLLGAALAPLGWLGYVAWVGVREGGALGYLRVQGGWGNGFDGGLAFAAFVGGRLTGPGYVSGLVLLAAVALVLWLYVRGVRQGQPLPLLVYAGVVLLLALTAKGYFGSKPRLMLPAFPLVLPLAVALARLRTGWAAAALGALALASAGYGAFWLNGTGPP
ncbi:mannosyltransferase family protein [Streptomyces sp. NPDC050617]|uniref:mannosyltransferase family protein n=1 Tax=Streptomyces sp. NPDC050617 TaxID=3154628 RepID=UPI00341C3721